MYSFISGTVCEARDGVIVLENNGVGFELSVSSNTLAQAGTVGKRLQLYTHLIVREDALTLFGFATREEKEMFLRLITISGIGPKIAQQILSACTPAQLALAVAASDVKSLAKLRGIGKKTAERLILELNGKLDDLDMTSGGFGGEAEPSSEAEAAINALCSLGISRMDAVKAVRLAAAETDKADEMVALALRRL
ncbi:MAG TPA: Holliday junction branch migration protein RuvA [Eubacteriales bacterium]|jgi:Holliday junction DNA helicase RuvA|nr:Holliday junction branch migration protein RuvA [Eubacteriales bacterium]HRU85047.1 Holliday junction branch migration protein RuvA [Eubacteriales bacterium]